MPIPAPDQFGYDGLPRSTWVEIDGAQLSNNLLRLKSLVKTRALAVVKANAYGHGLVGCATIFEAAGADYLGVANVAEGIILRNSGIRANILSLGVTSPEEIALAIKNRIEVFCWSEAQAEAFDSAAENLGMICNVHCKIDTGMGRLGAFPAEAVDLVDGISIKKHINIVGIASHFSGADLESSASAELQLHMFLDVLARLQQLGIRPPVAHIANTPASIRFPESRLDMCRLGIGLYGLKPDPMMDLPLEILPALQWFAKGSLPRQFPSGSSLSYGGEYVTKGAEWIVALPVGYADGFRRSPQNVNSVLCAGENLPIVGRICMDQCLVKLSSSSIDDSDFVLIGQSGQCTLSADDLARRWNTNVYDVVCGINVRVPRKFVGC